MSFSGSNTAKNAQNILGGAASTEQNVLAPADISGGTNMMNLGQGAIGSGINYYNSLLGGNTANTTAALQPSIDQVRQGSTATLGAINTLTPRGGGRYGSLFGQSFAPEGQIQNLFNSARSSAASALPQIGLQETGLGTNLFGQATPALAAATQAGTTLGNLGQSQAALNASILQSALAGPFGFLTSKLSDGGGGGGGGGQGSFGGGGSGAAGAAEVI